MNLKFKNKEVIRVKKNNRNEEQRQTIYISGVDSNGYWQQFQYRK